VAVTRTDDHELGDFLTAAGKTCFYCHGLIVADPAILWSGAYGNIHLHPACTVELAVRLFRDVHQIECEKHQYVTGKTP
jgi:hypothetical protein